MPKHVSTVSKEFLSNSIRNAFHEIEDEPWNDEELYKYINIAAEFNLHELASELINALPHQYQRNEYFNRFYTKHLEQ